MDYIAKGARISACGKYRYRLWREWRGTPNAKWRWWKEDDGSPCLDGAGNPIGEPLSCLFVMLNPSTADGQTDDPTIRRCVSFARSWGYDRLDVVNLFAYRATKPSVISDLLAANGDPFGWENSEIVGNAARDSGLIVCAWGAHGGLGQQDETMRGWLGDKKQFALGFTKDGHPRHPLYVSAAAALVPMPAPGIQERRDDDEEAYKT